MRVQYTCPVCNRPFFRKPSKPGKFCSRSCLAASHPKTPLIGRFFRYVTIPDDNSSCWLWVGLRDKRGYGLINSEGPKRRNRFAHRVSYEWFVGPIPGDRQVLHDCPTGDNPSCVNPDHLWLGTQADNVHDCMAKGRNLRGERKPNALLTDSQVQAIRQAHANGATITNLARVYYVSWSTISLVVKRRTWTHVP